MSADTLTAPPDSVPAKTHASLADAEIDLSLVDGMVSRIGKRSQDLIPLLQAIQKQWNWLPPAALERLAEITEITPDAITGVSTFTISFAIIRSASTSSRPVSAPPVTCGAPRSSTRPFTAI